jgi:hypothetical protein
MAMNPGFLKMLEARRKGKKTANPKMDSVSEEKAESMMTEAREKALTGKGKKEKEA